MTSADSRISALEQRLREAERALGILAGEQLNQSGEKPALTVVLRRYAPKPAAQKVVMPA
jgi:hypothetical protein